MIAYGHVFLILFQFLASVLPFFCINGSIIELWFCWVFLIHMHLKYISWMF
jgi:hypothetical protein